MTNSLEMTEDSFFSRFLSRNTSDRKDLAAKNQRKLNEFIKSLTELDSARPVLNLSTQNIVEQMIVGLDSIRSDLVSGLLENKKLDNKVFSIAIPAFHLGKEKTPYEKGGIDLSQNQSNFADDIINLIQSQEIRIFDISLADTFAMILKSINKTYFLSSVRHLEKKNTKQAKFRIISFIKLIQKIIEECPETVFVLNRNFNYNNESVLQLESKNYLFIEDRINEYLGSLENILWTVGLSEDQDKFETKDFRNSSWHADLGSPNELLVKNLFIVKEEVIETSAGEYGGINTRKSSNTDTSSSSLNVTTPTISNCYASVFLAEFYKGMPLPEMGVDIKRVFLESIRTNSTNTSLFIKEGKIVTDQSEYETKYKTYYLNGELKE